jgi:predicted PurR-regulated permease PerM
MEKWNRLLVVVVTWLLMFLLVGVIVRLTFYISHTVLLFSLATLLAYALDPVVEFLRQKCVISLAGRKRALSRSSSVGIVFFLMLGLIVFAIFALARPTIHQIRLLGDKHLQALYRHEIMGMVMRGDAQLKTLGVKQRMQDYFKDPSSLPPSLQSAESEIERSTVLFLGRLAVSVGETVIVLLITVYLLIFGTQMRQKFNAMLPAGLLPYASVWEDEVNRILGGFVRGQLTISILLGVVSAVACIAVGIRFWLLIGFFVAGASLIPVFGPYIGATPAIILALLTPTHFHNRIAAAIVLLAIFVTINEGASKVLYPRLVGKAIGLHEVLVLFVLFAGLELGGVPGVLFAAPVTAIAFATVVHLYRFWQNLPDSLIFTREKSELPTPGPD